MLQELFKDHQLYHSDFQMDFFITTRCGGTQYGMYKQSLRELFKRYRGLKGQYMSREEIVLDIAELKIKIKGWFSRGITKERNKIKLIQKRMGLEDLDKNIQETEREFQRFLSQATSLKKIIGELTTEKRNQLDCEMWIFKIKEQAAMDYMTKGRLTEKTIQLFQYLPKTIKRKLIEKIREEKGVSIVNWYNSLEYNLPEVKLSEFQNTQVLLEGNLK